jgi:hypothetical protein
MDVTSFKSMVDLHGGPHRVLSIVFNNAYTRAITDPDGFTYEKYIDEEHELMVFTEIDHRGIPFKIIKPIEYVEGIIFATNDEDVSRIDVRSVRG